MAYMSKAKEAELLFAELHKRKCQSNFYEFCKYVDPEFFTPAKWHLKVIADAMQEVADSKIKKLAVSLPPRAGKSYITSMFCAWVLGRETQKGNKPSVMRNSYAGKLAEKFSKDIRDGLIIHPKFMEVFPKVRLSKNSQAIDGWSLEGNTQPSYFCAGVGGAILGFGCNAVAILDDSIKNIEEALSETTIETLWSWYTSVHLSRLEIGCPEIHIATRWSIKDPIGRLTDPYSATYVKDMKVICIPALDENGNSFCEEIKTTAEYHELRKITDDIIWEAEFMQTPFESKGLLFPANELKRFSMADIKTKTSDGIVGFTDTADKGSDYLCSPIGKRFGNYTYVTDVVFTQDGVEVTEPLVAQQIIDTKCQIMQIESNNGGYQYSRNVQKIINGKSFCSIITCNATTNKETRILMASGYVKEYFYFRNDIEPGSDYDKFFRALTSYVKLGKNRHDDAPDAIASLADYLQRNLIQTTETIDPESEEGRFESMLDDFGRNVPNEFFRW